MQPPPPVIVAAPFRRPRLALPARAPAAVAAGAGAGLAWGIVARGWMRFISDAPEFTWSGTLGVVGIFAAFGLGQALAAVARRDGWPPGGRGSARAVAIVTTVPLGLAAGGPMLPSLVLAAVAAGRTTLRWPVRAALVLAALGLAALQLPPLLDDLARWRALVGWLAMLAVYAPLAWALGRSLRPFAPSAPGAAAAAAPTGG